jgi:hypothetical protein
LFHRIEQAWEASIFDRELGHCLIQTEATELYVAEIINQLHDFAMRKDSTVNTYPEVLSHCTSDCLVLDGPGSIPADYHLILPVQASLRLFEQISSNNKLIDADLLPRAGRIFEESKALRTLKIPDASRRRAFQGRRATSAALRTRNPDFAMGCRWQDVELLGRVSDLC